MRFRFSARLSLAWSIAVAVAAPAAAQNFDPNARPVVGANRISTAEAPVIDGDLSDPAWAKAGLIDNFKQRRPTPGAAATERTEVRLIYDDENLYIGIYAYDSDPSGIIVRAMARDARLDSGDNVGVYLDPGATRRNGYRFQIAPSGGRTDSIILNNAQLLNEWDTIWTGRARVTPDGWFAEIAVPFRSISYDPSQPEWGLEISRNLRRKNESLTWASQNPALEFSDISQSGTLTGISGVAHGLGLDVQVYGAVHSKRDWNIPGDDYGISATAGGNAFYKITPGLTATATFNPDFSDAPLDVRQVNTTRFSLFLPETRDFFLQDAANFEFGGLNFARGFDRSVNNARPFFSRNIGLVRGQPVSIIGGGKLSGEYGGFGIGALSVLTDDTPTSPGQVLSVARVTHRVLAESRVGMIVTHGDPTGQSDNTVAGADFDFRESDLWGGNVLAANVFYQRSFSSTRGDDDSFGAVVDFPNEPWGAVAGFKQIGSDFDPRLGFLNRAGIRVWDGEVRHMWRYREGFLRAVQLGTNTRAVTDLNDRLESRETIVASLELENAAGDQLDLQWDNYFEAVPAPFDLPGGVIVPTGDYGWNTVEIRFESSQGRNVTAIGSIECCNFYDGRGLLTEAELRYRPNRFFEAGLAWDMQQLDMPGGDVGIHVLAVDGTVNFTPDMQLVLQAQYDNISGGLGFLARYRWEFAPSDELFVSLGQAALIPDFRFRDVDARRSQFSVRLGHTFRF